MLNIRKGIVGGRLSQIVVERCRFSVNHVLAAVFKGKEGDHQCQKISALQVRRQPRVAWGLVDSVAGCEGNRDLTQEQVVYTRTTTRRGGNGALDTSVMLAPRSLRQPSKSRSLSDQSVYRAVFSCILGLTTAA